MMNIAPAVLIDLQHGFASQRDMYPDWLLVGANGKP